MFPLINSCPQAGSCGGCVFQGMPYAEQLAHKQKIVDGFFQQEEGISVMPIIPSFRQYEYRNKIELSFGYVDGQCVIGFHRKGSERQIVSALACNIFSPDLKPILQTLGDFVRDYGLSVYDNFTRKGFLRYLVIRTAQEHRELLINIVTTSQSTFDSSELQRRLLGLKLHGDIRSLLWTKSDSFSDAVVAEESVLMYGARCIQENILGVTYKIYPFSFFQVNCSILSFFYQKVASYVQNIPHRTVLDLFCGIGGLGLFLAQCVSSVIGVDVCGIENARENARANGLGNITFIQGDARRVLFENLNAWRRNFDIVLLNPPRSGMSYRIARRIVEIAPQTIFYSSCNPQTLAADLREFRLHYKIVLIQPFDFFPHTAHVETLVILEKR